MILRYSFLSFLLTFSIFITFLAGCQSGTDLPTLPVTGTGDTSDGNGNQSGTTELVPSSETSLTIENAKLAGNLTENQDGKITISCDVIDPEGKIGNVTVDLSNMGGLSNQPLFKQDGNTWACNGTFHPIGNGDKDIIFTATDINNASTICTLSVNINTPPSLTVLNISGDITVNQEGMVTISCLANDLDGAVTSVVVDLSAVGGSALQELTKADNNMWVWTGLIKPTAIGSQELTFGAIDDREGFVIVPSTVDVNSPPKIISSSVYGTLLKNQGQTITLLCSTQDFDGTVESVVADLSPLGGSNAQPLIGGGGIWSWVGTVTPLSCGEKVITLTATDDKNGSAFTQLTVSVYLVDSYIDGEFNGWDGSTIFVLQNGQVWMQAADDYHYDYEYSPRVLITEDISGSTMAVEGSDETVQVKPCEVVTDSFIDGTFRGWSNDTVFNLVNGEAWKQKDIAIEIRIAVRPRAVIVKDAGIYRMWVNGLAKSVRVVPE